MQMGGKRTRGEAGNEKNSFEFISWGGDLRIVEILEGEGRSGNRNEEEEFGGLAHDGEENILLADWEEEK